MNIKFLQNNNVFTQESCVLKSISCGKNSYFAFYYKNLYACMHIMLKYVAIKYFLHDTIK